jgi:hypothetical protein
VSSLYQPPEALSGRHDLGSFRCRSTEQTEWLHRHARQSASMGTTRVFVVTEHAETPLSPTTRGAWRKSSPTRQPIVFAKVPGGIPNPSLSSQGSASTPITKAED